MCAMNFTRTFAALDGSKFELGSSSIIIDGLLTRALHSAMRRRSPPDQFLPLSPIDDQEDSPRSVALASAELNKVSRLFAQTK